MAGRISMTRIARVSRSIPCFRKLWMVIAAWRLHFRTAPLANGTRSVDTFRQGVTNCLVLPGAAQLAGRRASAGSIQDNCRRVG